MTTEYFQIIGDLIIMLIALFAIFFILKKIRFSKTPEHKKVNIVNIVPVGAKEKIILVEVKGVSLLVGSTQNHIETLYVFNSEDSQPAPMNEADGEKSPFAEELSGLMKS